MPEHNSRKDRTDGPGPHRERIRTEASVLPMLETEDGKVWIGRTTDFLEEAADSRRGACWQRIRERQDLHFGILIGRAERFTECIPPDWGEGCGNVTVYCAVKDAQEAKERLPLFLTLKIRHKGIWLDPLLEKIEIRPYLENGQIEEVVCGGDTEKPARPLRYEWVLDVREQCIKTGTAFRFRQTGAVFVMNGKTFRIAMEHRKSQAEKAGIDYRPAAETFSKNERQSREEWLKTDLFVRIGASGFRSRFRLQAEDRAYVEEKGMDTIRRHAEDFVEKRLGPAYIPNDGKQTPMRGHPVFKAQHSCGCCCRGCLEKWHGIPKGNALTQAQKNYVADVLMEWIRRQMDEK